MPRLPKTIENCVGFMYRDAAAAKAGVGFGGTAFYIAIPAVKNPDFRHLYAVTNWHVIRDNFPCLRVNTENGGVDIFEIDPADWFFDPSTPCADIAVTPLPLRDEEYKIFPIPVNWFATDDVLKSRDIRPGEDVFMVGRFVDHESRQSNEPALRFGNISTMPVPVDHGYGWCGPAPSYILDMHSRSGYSGAPVFAYRTAGNDFLRRPKLFVGEIGFIVLLGIHWGQFKEAWNIEDSEALASEASVALKLSGNRQQVTGVSGMTVAHSAMEILRVLELPRLKELRALAELDLPAPIPTGDSTPVAKTDDE